MIVTHADGNRGVRFSAVFVCLCVCLYVFPHDISKPLQLSLNLSHENIYFGVKRSKVKVTRYKNSAGVDFCTPVSVGFL